MRPSSQNAQNRPASSDEIATAARRGRPRQKRGGHRIVMLIGVAVALVVAIAFSLDAFLVIELKSLDARYRLRGQTEGADEVVIVAIDDASFRGLQNQWPWPRALHADLIDRLATAGAQVIAFDILFLEPSAMGPDDDARLAEAAEQAGNVIFGHKLTHVVDANFRTTTLDQPNSVLTNAARSLGLVNHPLDPDGFSRRSYLYAWHQSGFQPTLSLAAVLARLDIPLELFAFDAAAGQSSLTLGGYDFQLVPEGPFAGTYFINFAGGPRSVRTISYYQVLEGLVPSEWIDGKIVFVGVVTPDLEDHFATPFFHQGLMPGVEVHANAALTLLNGNSLGIPAQSVSLLIIFVTAVSTAWICGRTSAFQGFFATAGMVAVLVGVAVRIFIAHDVWFQIVPPVAGVLLTYTFVNAYRFGAEERERRRIHGIFGRYVSPDVVDEILAHEKEIPLGGTRQVATLLFTDIRGFTSISEKLTPEEVVDHLNEYFQVMTEIIFRNQGTIDKFMGDAIMAIFGAPLPREDDALRCVRTAVEMRKALEQLQKRWERDGKPRFETGIGINTGEVIVGNIGSEHHLEYTAIGDEVNLASRLEGLTKDYGGGILMSEATYRLVKDFVEVERLDPVIVKGKEKPILIFKVLGLK